MPVHKTYNWIRHRFRRTTGRSFGLWWQFLLGFLGPVAGLVLGILLVMEQRQQTLLTQELEKLGLTIATHLAEVSAEPLASANVSALGRIVQTTGRNQDVAYTMVLDHAGAVVAYSGPGMVREAILHDAAHQHALHTSRPLVQRLEAPGILRETSYDFAVPVLVEGQKHGAVRVGMSLYGMRTARNQTRLWVLLIGVAGIILGTLAAACMARRISGPIQTLVKGTVAVARGDLHQLLPPVHSRDEFAVLTTNFNHMTRELLKQRTALEHTNRQLDQKVLELAILANYNESILASMTSGLFTLHLDGRFATFNAMAESITGLRQTEVQGQLYHQVFADNMQLVHFLRESRAQRQPVALPRLEFRRRDGHHVLLSLRTAMLHDHQRRMGGLLAIFEDLSLLDMLERQLHRADRLASLGQMTAGIAHEIKNPLASIRTFTQLVPRKHHDARFIEKFERIVPRELDRIRHIIDELLELTRPTQLCLGSVSITAILRRVIDVHTEQVRRQQVVSRLRFAPTMPPLTADGELLYRCFANLVLNAIEAMPAGGELTVACRPVSKAPVDLAAPDWKNALDTSRLDTLAFIMHTSDIEVVINDTGIGIPEEQLEMLFTPFHTTKSTGTGLGLALAQKIIEEHHGYIHVTSTVGQGTSVTVMLPALPSGSDEPAPHA